MAVFVCFLLLVFYVITVTEDDLIKRLNAW